MKKSTLLLLLILAIISTQAQDIQISFVGTGASSTVDSVKVVNVTQGTSITIGGTEVLHLPSSQGIEPNPDASENTLRIYPNPMNESSTIEFRATSSGTATIELFDVTGKKVAGLQNTLAVGTNSFKISGLQHGIYLVRISSKEYAYSGKLVSTNTTHSAISITFEGWKANSPQKFKSAEEANAISFNPGDLILFYGTSGIYITIVAIIPSQNIVITFNFVACTDADGYNYPVVQIGSQIWMAENLKSTRYRNGDIIPNVTGNAAWQGLSTGAWCYNNNDADNVAIYGRLYNFYAAIDNRNIAPSGWHLPTKAEWAQLTASIGGKANGGKLKETGTIHWSSPNVGATNETGFTARPGNSRDYDGHFGVLSLGAWWNSSPANNDTIWANGLISNNSTFVVVSYLKKQLGISVRCVMDDFHSVYTTAISNITSTTANSGGTIIWDGGVPVTACGVCWNTSGNPTTANSKTTDVASSGIFTSTLTGLTANTTYYCRAYATNNLGTEYGNEVTFKTLQSTGTGTVTDIDGNVYNTVTIGTQTWMAENLKVTHYRNGQAIPNVSDSVQWDGLTTGAYCWYNNDINWKDAYGALYNGYTLNDSSNLCPTGWHIPSKPEWVILFFYCVDPNIAGYYLKSCRTDPAPHPRWEYPNSTNNKYGFSALPGGYRDTSHNNFSCIGTNGFWWSSSESNFGNGNFSYHYLNHYSDMFYSNCWSRNAGFSVRCLKD